VKKTIAVDFDGVIHKYSAGWQNGTIYDVPVDGAFEGLSKLIEEYNVVIHTTRENHEDVRRWMRKYFIQTPWVETIEITSTKPKAIAYIDDRAIRFTSWEDVRKYFT
jgi:5'(3')-deoxyribonucleotidase